VPAIDPRLHEIENQILFMVGEGRRNICGKRTLSVAVPLQQALPSPGARLGMQKLETLPEEDGYAL
jgi:hypothetical protein